jgi:HSP20 family protein
MEADDFRFSNHNHGRKTMNQLTHWNPFKSLSRFGASNEFDELLRNVGLRPFVGQFDVPDIRVDVDEGDKAYTVKADIPGVKKEDIDVSVEGRQVTICATTSAKSEKKDKTSLYTERSEGRVFRSFALPEEVDGSNAQARYENGVLDLTLPKKSNGNAKRIAVS